ncbi:MAG TPA: hypothetical protein VKW76_12715 [Candidatus Binatia bacterium]|nr:hypothetical protein [Candidatus Binatia bacterium]
MRIRPLLPCLVALGLLAGCVTVDATLKADGSGTIEYTYTPDADATAASEKARFASPHLTIESLTLKDKTAVLKGKFDDVTKLDTAEGFKLATITRTRKDDDEVLDVTLANPKPVPEGKVPTLPDMVFSVTLPGKVINATPTAKIDGTHVTWTIKAADYIRAPKTELSARYAASDAKKGAAS